MSSPEWLRARLHAFFFTPANAVDLGVARFVFYGGTFVWLARSWGRPLPLPSEMAAWREFAPALWHPVAIHRWLPFVSLSAEALRWIGVSFLVSLALSALGLFTRITTACSLVLALVCLGYVNDFGFVDQQNNLTMLVLGGMAFGRTGDAFSLDAWFRRRSGTSVPLQPSGEYRWPIRFAALCLVLVYFSSAIAKLRESGFGWTRGEDLAWLITSHSLGDPSTLRFGVVPYAWALNVAKNTALCSLLAKSTLALELGAPLALLDRRAFAVTMFALFVMTASMSALMGVTFALTFSPVYAMEVPWASIRRRFMGRWIST
jgi:hypothetical protein